MTIETHYRDAWGEERVVPENTVRRIREILGPELLTPPFPIDAPERAYLPPALEGGARTTGIAVQLYGLRSRRNWGMGDFGDLARLIELAGRAGIGAIGLNPLHALFPGDPTRYSPYAPSSRLLLNVLYIDVEAVPEFATCEAARARVASTEFQDALAGLRAAPLVEYAGVSKRKLEILELLHAEYRDRASGKRVGAFEAFCERRGRPLRALAVFEALSERLGPDWRDWPAQYRHPSEAELARIAAAHADRVGYYEYLQFLADEQLARASSLCRTVGMAVGLYIDLAVGVDINGAEAWRDQDVLALGVTVGAPPDLMNMKGQNWGFPPYHPGRLRETGYAPFVEMLRANMRGTGAIRIDHVLGLMRLYWLPLGAAPGDGGYVTYPFDELVAVIARESERHGCLVVGEDLGTVPTGLRERLRAARILSYRLLYFERDDDGSYLPPDTYPDLALAAVSTHDLPTLRGWWTGRDLGLRRELNLFPSPQVEERERRAREQDRQLLLEALAREGLFADDPDMRWREFTVAVHRYLARTPAKLLMVQLEDVLGLEDQVNVPGTIGQHPNWRRKLPIEIERLFEQPGVRAVLGGIADERG
jgi:4-alpha-glucanotransferase